MKPGAKKKNKTIQPEQQNMADELRHEVLSIGGSVRGPLPAAYRG